MEKEQPMTMVQKFNQAGIACSTYDAISVAIKKHNNLSKEEMIALPEKWWDANRASTKVAPGWGAKANYDDYDAKAHYDSLVHIRDVGAKIVEQSAGKEALATYWSEIETRQKRIWTEYQ